jgi:signal peptidase II|tara:strand:+ start:168 stop:668 length:501 start_codon:yes stop_codon:yes gene_type:complete
MLKKNYKKIITYLFIVLTIFLIDRVSKLYILNLAETTSEVNLYIYSFLNFYLIWNTGISFGLFSSNHILFYHLITTLIILINIVILVMIIKTKDKKRFFLLIILGGSLGNLFDRLYYNAVPDFIELHYNSFHWFIFNVADIFISLGIICLILVEIFIDKELKNENN